MNPFCECTTTGFCKRHNKVKGAEQFARCQGTAGTPDCGLKYWNAWEEGRAGATAPDNPKLNPPGFCEGKNNQPARIVEYKSSVGDMLSEIIKRETGKPIPCQACQADIDELNSMTADDCAKLKQKYVDNIYSRAFASANILQKAGIILDKIMHTGVTVSRIGEWFDEALLLGVQKKNHDRSLSQRSPETAGNSCKSC